VTLPVPLTSFVGREREVAAVAALLGGTRLVTLTGAAGSGKTRMALAVAARAQGETAWVDLAPLARPELLPAYVGSRLGIAEEPERAPWDTLAGALGRRELLLVLDNCEHLADGCAHLVDGLLRACPRLRVLATSREALSVSGERAWQVPLLAEDDSVTLFAERAAAVAPHLPLLPHHRDTVAAICRRLDGLPLAIELAAARVAVLAPAQLLERLDEALRSLGSGARTAPPRQRTLRGALDWSYSLLGEPERLLLSRLAVFAGSFSLTAVERIAADDRLPADTVLEALATLVEKSLVMMELRQGEARYRLLEIVRQYAQEQLAESGDETALRRRHAEFFLALVEPCGEGLLGYGARQWVALIDDELPNLRAVFEWAPHDPACAEIALRLGRELLWFWIATGQLAEGRARLAAVLARAGASRARGSALATLGFLGLCESDRESRRPLLEESERLLRAGDDPAGLAFALLALGMTDLIGGRPDDAEPRLREAAELARAASHPVLLAQALYYLGSTARVRGDAAAARAALEAAIAVTSRPGLEFAYGYCAARLGALHHLAGDDAQALRWLERALAVHGRHVDLDRWGTVQVLDAVAGVAVAQGRAESAARLLGAAEVFCRRMDVAAPLDLREYHELFSAGARAALGAAAWERVCAEGMALGLEEALAEADRLVAQLGAAGEAAAEPAVAPVRAPVVAPAPAAAAAALEVRALGALEILCDGVPVPPTAWRAARPRELLLYLLTHRAGLTRDQIALTFWPDASPAQVKNNFHVTLHHLRRALGRTDLVIFDDERYRVRWELGVVFDAALFETELRDALRGGPAGLSADALRAALARYRGDFLADAAAGDWHLESRDYLRRLYRDGLLALAEHEETGSRFAAAAEAYRRLLALDPLDEAAARRLMRCLARHGDRAEALRTFERLSRALRAELAAEPDRDTLALAERVRRAEPL
jgi:predicted ATPase/DNA-binding SARP family transcriptional activator